MSHEVGQKCGWCVLTECEGVLHEDVCSVYTDLQHGYRYMGWYHRGIIVLLYAGTSTNSVYVSFEHLAQDHHT